MAVAGRNFREYVMVSRIWYLNDFKSFQTSSSTVYLEAHTYAKVTPNLRVTRVDKIVQFEASEVALLSERCVHQAMWW